MFQLRQWPDDSQEPTRYVIESDYVSFDVSCLNEGIHIEIAKKPSDEELYLILPKEAAFQLARYLEKAISEVKQWKRTES